MIAGVETDTLLVLLAVAVGAGIAGGVLAGLLGVGGGIVIVPALYLALSAADLGEVGSPGTELEFAL